MRLASEFIRLPLEFDVDRLLEEAHQFSEYDWGYHPLNYEGNTALSLVSSGGGVANSTAGAMLGTDALKRTPYVQQVMASFGTVIGRSRFMRLAPGKNVPQHADTEYAWRNRVRIHIPIITDPEIIFSSISADGQSNVDVHMRAGEAWIFDNWREHAVINQSDVRRIHLVIDTVGTAKFWNLAESGWDPRTSIDNWEGGVKKVHYQDDLLPELRFEKYTSVPVRSPDEVESIVRELIQEISHLENRAPYTFEEITTVLNSFCQDWRGNWSLYWDSMDAIPHYQALIQEAKNSLKPKLNNVVLQTNRVAAYDVLAKWLDACTDESISKKLVVPQSSSSQVHKARSLYVGKKPAFTVPIFVVAAPRSGSTMLFEALRNNKGLWSIGDEAHREIESIDSLSPRNRDFDSNALTAQDCNDAIKEQIVDSFMLRLQNSQGVSYSELAYEYQPSEIRFLEKTPKNALRIPFLKAMFPDAKFVYLHRKPQANIGSIIDAWQSQRFVTYPKLPDWTGLNWSLLLCEGWRAFINKPIAEVAVFQWSNTNSKIIDDLSTLDSTDYHVMSYEDLLAQPMEALQAVCSFANVPFGPKMQSFAQSGFPNSKYALSNPAADKWKRHQTEIEQLESVFIRMQNRIMGFAK